MVINTPIKRIIRSLSQEKILISDLGLRLDAGEEIDVLKAEAYNNKYYRTLSQLGNSQDLDQLVSSGLCEIEDEDGNILSTAQATRATYESTLYDVDNATGSGGDGVNGAVFVTNVTAQGAGNIGSHVYESGDDPSNFDLVSCTTDTTEVTISVEVDGGHSSWTPTLTMTPGDVSVSLSQISVDDYYPYYSDKMNLSYNGSDDVYAIVRKVSTGQVWNGSSFEVWSDSNIYNYDIPLSDQGGDLYSEDFPSSVDANIQYVIFYYEQAGSSPATDDLILDSESVIWDGTNLIRKSSTNLHRFSGTVDVSVPSGEATTYTFTHEDGATDTVVITHTTDAPSISAALFGSLPGSQTEVKSGDTVSITGTMSSGTTEIDVLATGASYSVQNFSVSGTTFNISITIGTGSGSQVATLRPKNSLGTTGSNFDTTNSVTLNQTYPTVGSFSVSYPGAQGALKDSESATVSSTVTNYDTIAYSSGNSQLSIADPTTYGASKTATRIAGNYNDSTNNYTIAATRSANNATTTSSTVVKIAHTFPTIDITIGGSPTRLKSSTTGNDYVITITSDQELNSDPSMTAGSGTWQGATFADSGDEKVWTRTLRIADSDSKGATTFSSLSSTNKALKEQTSINSGASYTVGGFTSRTVTFPAFDNEEAIGTSVVDTAKLVCNDNGDVSLTYQASTTNGDHKFTITSPSGVPNATGNLLYWADNQAVIANTQGTAFLEIEETE